MDSTQRPEPDAGEPRATGADGLAEGDGMHEADDHDVARSASEDDETVPHDPLRFNQWMKRSATGAVMSGIALGLREALEPKRNLPAFVMEAPGEPDDPDAPISLHFDPDDPTKTVAVIRPPRSTVVPDVDPPARP